MAKLSIADEMFRCIQAGWNITGRKGTQLAFAEKIIPEKEITHTLYENGIRVFKGPNNKNLTCYPDGRITTLFNDYTHEWIKDPISGFTGWKGRFAEMLNSIRFRGYTYTPRNNDLMAKTQKIRKNGDIITIYENGRKTLKKADGTFITREPDGRILKSNMGYREKVYTIDPENGRHCWA